MLSLLYGPSFTESVCNAGDPSSIPGSERSPGEWIGYPLQYSWASLLIQTLKNLPAVRKIWVQFLGWEDALEEGMATHSSILTWRIPLRILAGYSPWGHKKSDMTEWLSTAQMSEIPCFNIFTFDLFCFTIILSSSFFFFFQIIYCHSLNHDP